LLSFGGTVIDRARAFDAAAPDQTLTPVASERNRADAEAISVAIDSKAVAVRTTSAGSPAIWGNDCVGTARRY
jgi:hypothetical protein